MSEYISRSKLKAHYSWLGKGTTLSPKDLDDIIDAQPAADVEPVVRGEWQNAYENTTFGAMYRCSVCGETTFNVENFKYCPKCGTRMSMERSGSGE